jgi:hypothetical protein
MAGVVPTLRSAFEEDIMQPQPGSDATREHPVLRRTGACLAALSALILPSFSAVGAADKKPAPPPVTTPPAADSCAVANASARYVGYGYTHVVVLHNKCDKTVECALWTDVDPEPRTTVKVARGASAEVVTRRGSPASDFQALKSCSYR